MPVPCHPYRSGIAADACADSGAAVPGMTPLIPIDAASVRFFWVFVVTLFISFSP